jgi:hypothetical protein
LFRIVTPFGSEYHQRSTDIERRHQGQPANLFRLTTRVSRRTRAGPERNAVDRVAGERLVASTITPTAMVSPGTTAIDLYWLPLGAGGQSVRLNGRIFEWFAARLAHRDRCDLYHCALEVRVPEGRFVIEQSPAWGEGGERGVVTEGAVGIHAAGRLRLFRYEIRRWRDGVIPDVSEAVESPQRLSDNTDRARYLLELVPQVPTPVWGRDEMRTCEMWNSNSLISWLITRSGLDVDSIHLPRGGRAPGWHAGVVIAKRQRAMAEPAATAEPE